MSLYDKVQDAVESAAPKKGMGFDSRLLVKVLFGLGVIAVLVFAFMYASKQEQVSVSFAKNSLKSGDETTMTVVFRNNTGKDLENVTISLKAVDTKLLLFSQNSYSYENVAMGQEREKDITVKALQGIDSGTYAIEVTATGTELEGKPYRVSMRVE